MRNTKTGPRSALQNLLKEQRTNILAVIVHLNDTYLIEEITAQGVPGFPRAISTVRAIRSLVKDIVGHDRTIVVHSGDFLGPARFSKADQGRLMTDMLRLLPVDFCVVGNHEFDYGKRILAQRLEELNARILVSNATVSGLTFSKVAYWPSEDKPDLVLAGAVSESVAKSFGTDAEIVDPRAALQAIFESTSHVPFKVVLTHATREEDRNIREALPKHRLLMLGGHDHDIDWVENDGPPIYKNLANLKTIRVVVLLAGGSSTVIPMLGHLDDIEREHGRVPWLSRDLPKLLSRLPPQDAVRVEVELAALPAATREKLISLERENGVPSDEGVFDKATEGRSLEQALLQMRGSFSARDIQDFVFRISDHETAALDARMVLAVDRVFKFRPSSLLRRNKEHEIVRDFTPDGVSALETRETHLRRAATSFGIFVAECARLATGADVAIVNAGSFRSDNELSARLTHGDLLDCFLYDRSDALVTFRLKSSIVGQLIEHGLAKQGSGAFPQYSPPAFNASNDKEINLCISSYLVLQEDSIDGYREVLARNLDVDIGGLAGWLSSRVDKRMAVIECVRREARRCTWVTATSSLDDDDSVVAQLILIIDELARAPAEQRETIRNSGRILLHKLPEVQEFHASKDKGNTIQAYLKSLQALGEIYTILETHPARFRNQINYSYEFKWIAHGVGGWLA